MVKMIGCFPEDGTSEYKGDTKELAVGLIGDKLRQVAGLTGQVQSHETESMGVVPTGEISFETLHLPVAALPHFTCG